MKSRIILKKAAFLMLTLVLTVVLCYCLYSVGNAQYYSYGDWEEATRTDLYGEDTYYSGSQEKVTLYSLDGWTLKVDASDVAEYQAKGWYLYDDYLAKKAEQDKVTMYTLDGRSAKIAKDKVAAYQAVGWYLYDDYLAKKSEQDKVTMYALDGRTAKIAKDKVAAYQAVGWYLYDDYLAKKEELNKVTMYALDGRTAKIAKDKVSAYQAVGWYLYDDYLAKKEELNKVTMYALDGRTAKIAKDKVAAYQAVGWYLYDDYLAKKSGTEKVPMYALDGRTAKIAKDKVAAYQAVGWYLYEDYLAKKGIEATGITLNKTGFVLFSGQSLKLSATIQPENVTKKTVTWTSSNINVATVSSAGVVTANSSGITTITAKTSNGKSVTCKISVCKDLSTFLDLMDPVQDKEGKCIEKMGEALTYFQKKKYASSLNSAKSAAAYVQQAINLCGDYPELSGRKRVFQSMYDDFQSLPDWTWSEDIPLIEVYYTIERVLPKCELLSFKDDSYYYFLIGVYDGPSAENPYADYTFEYVRLQKGTTDYTLCSVNYAWNVLN